MTTYKRNQSQIKWIKEFLFAGIFITSFFSFVACSMFNPNGTQPSVTVKPEGTSIKTKIIEKYRSPTPYFIYTQESSMSPLIEPKQLVQRWLCGIPCTTPCWEDVTPGQTTFIDAANIWSKNPLFDEIEIVGENRGQEISFYANTSSFTFSGEVPFFHGNLNIPIDLIRIFGIFNEVKISEIINSFDEPSHIIAEERISSQGDPIWFINIIWLPIGFSVSSIGFLPPPTIDENLALENGTFFVPGEDGFSKTDMAMDINGQLITLNTWHGYDNFEGYVLSPTPTP